MRFASKTLITAAVFAVSMASNVFAADDTQGIYKSKCQTCHGVDGKATAVGKKLGARDFSDPEVVKTPDTELASITSNGKNKMPAYKGKLSDDQIKALVQYIRGLK